MCRRIMNIFPDIRIMNTIKSVFQYDELKNIFIKVSAFKLIYVLYLLNY